MDNGRVMVSTETAPPLEARARSSPDPPSFSVTILSRRMTGVELAAACKNQQLTEVELGKAIGYRDPARSVRRLEASVAVNSRALNMIKVTFGAVDQDNVRERGSRRRVPHPDQLSFAF